MVALNLLKASTFCTDIEKEQEEIKNSLYKSTGDRQRYLDEVKKLELELRRIDNTHSDRSREINKLKQDILTFKQDSIHKQKQMDNTKQLVQQKKMVLAKLEENNLENIKRKQDCEKAIKQSKTELTKIQKQTQESDKLKSMEAQREEYF